jgi:hypothetical protein
MVRIGKGGLTAALIAERYEHNNWRLTLFTTPRLMSCACQIKAVP